jgi:UDP-N-acetylmuramyl tripeptide synthase
MTFAAGVFTNLTHDHLDFMSEDMEAYYLAKRRLEVLPHDAPGVVNMDDSRGVRWSGVRTANHLRDHRRRRCQARDRRHDARRTAI